MTKAPAEWRLTQRYRARFSPTKAPPFLSQRMRIKVAKRIPVFCGNPVFVNKVGKPMPWILTKRFPSASSRLIRSTVFTTASMEFPVNSSPKMYKLTLSRPP